MFIYIHIYIYIYIDIYIYIYRDRERERERERDIYIYMKIYVYNNSPNRVCSMGSGAFKAGQGPLPARASALANIMSFAGV